MTPAAHVAAAIEILADLAARRRPAADAVKDWGVSHRFAGSRDRAAISNLIYDSLRKRASAAFLMGEETPRALMIGALREARGLAPDAIGALFSGEGHAPAPLTVQEIERLSHTLAEAPDAVRGDYPEWLAERFAAAFGETAASEGAALAMRAPIDLRVNILKLSRDDALARLDHLAPQETPLSPLGLRLAPGPTGRGPALAAEPAYARGYVETQDEASQLAALLCAAEPGEQTLDLCAGGGGKTLALAGQMHNRGQIYAHDSDGRRLTPIIDRLERAGARNVQLRAPRGKADVLADLVGRCDLVLIDAPCTGTGTWRRHPDAKWRLSPGALEQRVVEQRDLLTQGARYVRSGGRMVYVTCSVLRDENEAQIAAFLTEAPGFAAVAATEMTARAGLPELARFASPHGAGLRFSPHSSNTDGFYVAMLEKA